MMAVPFVGQFQTRLSVTNKVASNRVRGAFAPLAFSPETRNLCLTS